MDGEHDALERRLRLLGAEGPGVDTAALAAGARGRAAGLRRQRRRRRLAAGALALVALAVPTGLSRFDDERGTARTEVAGPPPAAAAVPPQALLDTAAVAAVLPGAVEDPATRRGPLAEPLTAGLCRDDTSSAAGALLAGRAARWDAPGTVAQPLPQAVDEQVLLLAGDGAAAHLAQVREQVPGCAAGALETGPWEVREEAGIGEESITGWALAQELDGVDPQWRVRVVARAGDVVVRLDTTVFSADAATAVRGAEDLTAEALRRASTGVVR
ncbi:hypothetical protein [Kineococcus sp. SYSU DK005]|uniref:hypothetical protein n=1 Tax=Kineococcus sp. SYSU DK005 TaxID=3383126 RepID=UPI003D7C76EF